MKYTSLLLLQACQAAQTFTDDLLVEADYEFFGFVSKYNKSYGTKEEFKFRSGIFKQKYEEIQEWNTSN